MSRGVPNLHDCARLTLIRRCGRPSLNASSRSISWLTNDRAVFSSVTAPALVLQMRGISADRARRTGSSDQQRSGASARPKARASADALAASRRDNFRHCAICPTVKPTSARLRRNLRVADTFGLAEASRPKPKHSHAPTAMQQPEIAGTPTPTRFGEYGAKS